MEPGHWLWPRGSGVAAMLHGYGKICCVAACSCISLLHAVASSCLLACVLLDGAVLGPLPPAGYRVTFQYPDFTGLDGVKVGSFNATTNQMSLFTLDLVGCLSYCAIPRVAAPK